MAARDPSHLVLSGGEPTLHPNFLDAIRYARKIGYFAVQCATNGLRFAEEPGFAKQCKEAGLRMAYLQFDGVTNQANSHRKIANLYDVKLRAIEELSNAGIDVILVVTIVNGVNDDQVGPIVQFAVDNADKITVVSFQPVSFTGRDEDVDDETRARQRYTLSHLARDVSAQAGVTHPMKDWFPLSSLSPFGDVCDLLDGPDRDFGEAMRRVEQAIGATAAPGGPAPSRDAHFVCALALAWPDGHVEWSISSPPNEGCARNLVGNLLACQKRRPDGGQAGLQFIDIGTGKVVSTADSPGSMIASDGTNLYVAGYSRDVDADVVTKGTPQDPAADWKTVIRTDQCAGYGSGDALDLDVRNGVLFGYNGGAEIALRTGDGSPLFDHEVMNVHLREPSSIVANPCAREQNSDKWPTEVVNLDGNRLFTTPSRIPGERLGVYRGGPPPFTTVDGQALDPMTGEKLWRISTAVNWLVGNVGVVRGDGTIDAYDMLSGNQLWHNRLSASYGDGITDGTNIILPITGDHEAPGGIGAVSLADGSAVWEVTGDVLEAPVLYATDAGILAVWQTGITLYRDRKSVV